MERIYKKSRIPLGDDELTEILKPFNIKVMIYEDLKKFNSIQQLLPREKDAVVILVLMEETSGHYVSVLRNKKNILFFCSYGFRPDKHLLWVDKQTRRDLNQNIPHLSYLLNRAIDDKFKVSFSEIKFQDYKDGSISTCGRHIALLIKYWFRTDNPNLKGYLQYINRLVKDYQLNYDLIVSKLI